MCRSCLPRCVASSGRLKHVGCQFRPGTISLESVQSTPLGSHDTCYVLEACIQLRVSLQEFTCCRSEVGRSMLQSCCYLEQVSFCALVCSLCAYSVNVLLHSLLAPLLLPRESGVAL